MRILDPKVDPAYKDQLQQLREMCAKAFASFERKLGPGPVVNILIKWDLDEVKAMKELGDIVEQNKAARRQKCWKSGVACRHYTSIICCGKEDF